jgi:hypothetical protein
MDKLRQFPSAYALYFPGNIWEFICVSMTDNGPSQLNYARCTTRHVFQINALLACFLLSESPREGFFVKKKYFHPKSSISPLFIILAKSL